MKTLETTVHSTQTRAARGTSHGSLAHNHIQETPEQHMAKMERKVEAARHEYRRTEIVELIDKLPSLFDIPTTKEEVMALLAEQVKEALVAPRVKRAYVRKIKLRRSTGKRAFISDTKRARIIKAALAGRRNVTAISLAESVSRQSVYAIMAKERARLAVVNGAPKTETAPVEAVAPVATPNTAPTA